jgi:uncharacterized protein YecT (DUF1311 family)
MKAVDAIVVMALLSGAAHAQSGDEFDCAKPDDLPQMGLNFCAYADFETADAALNAVWSNLRNELRNDEAATPEFKGWFEKALSAQRNWLVYRDAQCDAEAYAFTGGSMQSMIVSGCQTRLTNARIAEISQMMDEN